MRAIIPSLWFDTDLADVTAFYLAVFPGSSSGQEFRDQAGKLVSTEMVLAGNRFIAINGGPQFSFTEAVSFLVECETQDEVDHYWQVLVDSGGSESRCGWLKDKFGVSWQIVPFEFLQMLRHRDPAAVQRVVDVMLTQRKLDLGPLRNAFAADPATGSDGPLHTAS